MPAAIVNAYQGLLPTYLYAFQFDVNTTTASAATSFATGRSSCSSLALVVACAVVGYAPGRGARRWPRVPRPSRIPGRPGSPARPDAQPGRSSIGMGAPWASGSRSAVRPPVTRHEERPRRRRHLGREVRRQRPGRGEAADHEPVVVVDLRGHPRPAELLGAPLARPRTSAAASARSSSSRRIQRLGEGLGVARRRAAPRGHAARRPCSRGCRWRRSARPRPSPRAARSRTTRGRSPASSRRRRSGTAGHARRRTRGPGSRRSGAGGSRRTGAPRAPGARRPRAAAGILEAGLAQDPERLEQVEHALAGLEPPDEQDVGGPVLPARERHGPAEAVDVDAVGDDLVVAREVAVDEVARGRRHRDPAVEPLRVAAHRPAPELVGGRPAAVGVERADVDALALAQEHERQERHERLVEVEDVEPLLRRAGRGPATRSAATP